MASAALCDALGPGSPPGLRLKAALSVLAMDASPEPDGPADPEKLGRDRAVVDRQRELEALAGIGTFSTRPASEGALDFAARLAEAQDADGGAESPEARWRVDRPAGPAYTGAAGAVRV